MRRFPNRKQLARICVVGVGDGGNQAIQRMITDGVRGVDFIAVNTGTLSLLKSEAPTRIQIGNRGQGTGGNIALGRQAALASKFELEHALDQADMVFIATGMGGGTGSGAAPVIAELARKMGALTIGIVTYPFTFEGKRRMANAQRGLQQMQKHAHTMITIMNDRLLDKVEDKTSMKAAFNLADDILRQAVTTITAVVQTTGLINVDFADVKSVLSLGGASLMSVGCGTGPNRARMAAERVVNCDLLGTTMDGAKGILFNVMAGPDLGTHELQMAAEIVRERADPDANFIMGVVQNPLLGDEVRITMIATGFEHLTPQPQPEERVSAILQRVTPAPEPVTTRRVYLSRPKRTRHSERTPLHRPTKFSREQWGIPAFLRK